MKFLFLSLILLLPLASAVEFSPTSLEFNLEKNEQVCKMINFRLDSQASVSDVWASDSSSPWSVTQFQTSSQTHGLNLEYQTQIVQEQNQAEVCLSGTRSGNFRGALIFRQSEQGNSIVQFAIWLKVNIAGTNQQTEEKPETSSNRKSHSSRSSNANGGISEYVVIDNSKPKKEIEQLSFNFPEEKIEINSAKSKKQLEKTHLTIPILAISLTAIMFLVLLFFIIKK